MPTGLFLANFNFIPSIFYYTCLDFDTLEQVVKSAKSQNDAIIICLYYQL